jgi:hypothetical protein
MRARHLTLPLLALGSIAGCPTPPPATSDAGTAFFPADYETRYAEVRDCRRSPDHDLSYIRVLASPDAEGTYTTRTGDFAEGAILVKPEYADDLCTDLLGITAMRRTAGSWEFQETDTMGRVVSTDTLRCIGCHASCGVPPDGFMGTCALP